MGVPVIIPVVVLIERPGGRLVAPKLVGPLLAETVRAEMAWPTVPEAAEGPEITGIAPVEKSAYARAVELSAVWGKLLEAVAKTAPLGVVRRKSLSVAGDPPAVS